MCCKCCELGVHAGRHLEDCEPVAVLDEKCGEQFTNCCKKSKSCNWSKKSIGSICLFSLVICDSGFEMDDNGRCHGMYFQKN
jgi:hypothetical protein